MGYVAPIALHRENRVNLFRDSIILDCCYFVTI